MKKAALILCLALLPQLVLAQKKVAVVRVRYANAHAIAALLASGTPVTVNADGTLQVIVLKGEPDAVASLEQTIHELDVPSAVPASKDIEVIVSVIGASSDLPAGQEMSEGMAPVVKQLRAIFPYKNYQLLSSMLLRSREGAKAENRGNMKSLAVNNSDPISYYLGYVDGTVSSEQGKPVVHLRGFQFSAKSSTLPSINIETDVDLPEGQKTVVGKANVEKGDSALFIVLTAKLVD